MSNTRYLNIAMASLLALPGLVMATEEQGRAAAERLSEELRGYRTYQADFTQTVMDAGGNTVQQSEGSLKAKRPGLFYWETEDPMAQFIVADGETVEVYDPDLEQVTIYSLDTQVANTPALLLSGEVDDLGETYEVAFAETGEGSSQYTLRPKDPDSLFVSLQMTYQGGELSEMQLNDSMDQRSVLSFENVRLNEDLADSAFRLAYPDSVDVIRDSQ